MSNMAQIFRVFKIVDNANPPKVSMISQCKAAGGLGCCNLEKYYRGGHILSTDSPRAVTSASHSSNLLPDANHLSSCSLVRLQPYQGPLKIFRWGRVPSDNKPSLFPSRNDIHRKLSSFVSPPSINQRFTFLSLSLSLRRSTSCDGSSRTSLELVMSNTPSLSFAM